MTLNCVNIKNSNHSQMKEFNCSFIGNDDDISSFLGGEKINKGEDFQLQVFANQYIFLKNGKSLMMYGFDNETNVFETFKLKEVSTQLKTDRKYKMNLIDSTEHGFKMKIQSGDKTFTQMKGSITIVVTND